VKIAPSNKVFADVNSEADRSDNNLFQVSLRHRPDGACDNRLHAIPAGSSERRSENLHRPGLTAVPWQCRACNGPMCFICRLRHYYIVWADARNLPTHPHER